MPYIEYIEASTARFDNIKAALKAASDCVEKEAQHLARTHGIRPLYDVCQVAIAGPNSRDGRHTVSCAVIAFDEAGRELEGRGLHLTAEGDVIRLKPWEQVLSAN